MNKPDPLSRSITASDAVSPAAEVVALVRDDPLVEDDLLVEDVSIDGMCGVY